MTNDTFRTNTVVNSPKTIELMRSIKEKATELEHLYDKAINAVHITHDKKNMRNFSNLREIALAKTKLEESVMWGIKAATKTEYYEITGK